MSYSIIAAIALVCIIEGILPFAAPNLWRNMVRKMASQPTRSLRIIGFVLMLLGVVILVVAHQFY